MAIVLDTDELPLVDHTWRQAFDGVRVQVARNGGFLPTAWSIFLRVKKKKSSKYSERGAFKDDVESSSKKNEGYMQLHSGGK